MALDTYADLQLEVLRWMARDTDPNDVVIGAVPTFIALVEAEVKRRLRRYTGTTTISVADESTPLPVGVMELRSARVLTVNGSLGGNMIVGTMATLTDFRAFEAGVLGQPRHIAIYGGNLHVVPQPDRAYDVEINYFQSIVPLSATNPTNSVLTDSPDVYLFGALKFAESYMEHDERIETWSRQFEAALDQLEIAREREEFGAGPLPARNKGAMR